MERCRELVILLQAIRVFFHLRSLSMRLQQEVDDELPLTRQDECVKLNDVLDLSECFVFIRIHTHMYLGSSPRKRSSGSADSRG